MVVVSILERLTRIDVYLNGRYKYFTHGYKIRIYQTLKHLLPSVSKNTSPL